MELGEWVKNFNAPKDFLISGPNYESVRITLPDGRCYGRVIPRLQFDNMLLHQATKAGVLVKQETFPVEFERPGSDQVCVTVKHGKTNKEVKLTSRMVIAADGAHGSFTKKLGLIKGLPDLVAIRAYFEDVDCLENRMEFHYDPAIMPGYAWIFPMGDGKANVGLGTYTSRSKQRKVDLKQAFAQFLEQNPYARKKLGKARMISQIKGFPIRTEMNKSIPFADNVLVAGEAAGVVDPITGDGISEALETGELAAQHAFQALERNKFSKGDLAPYGKSLKQKYGFKHRSAHLLRHVLGHNAIMNRVIRRAQHDDGFALTLCYIILGLKPPYVALRPDNVGRAMLG
jgi:geranylgeranyl reductase family protein